MIKLRNLLEGVSENDELFNLSMIILNEFSKVQKEQWGAFHGIYLQNLKKFSRNFNYLSILFDSNLKVKIFGDEDYYMPSGPVIILKFRNVDYSSPKTALKKYYLSSLVHELQHAYDDIRSKGKNKTDKKSLRYFKNLVNSKYLYLTLPHEVWARFAEFGEQITSNIDKSEIYERLKDSFEGWQFLNKDMQKRILKSAYKLYDLRKNAKNT